MMLAGTTPTETMGFIYADSTRGDTVTITVSDTSYVPYNVPKNYYYSTQQRVYYFDPAPKKLLKMTVRDVHDANYNNLIPHVYDYIYGYGFQGGTASRLSISLYASGVVGYTTNIGNYMNGLQFDTHDTVYSSLASGRPDNIYTDISADGRIDSVVSQNVYPYSENQYFTNKIPGYNYTNNGVSVYAYNYNTDKKCTGVILKNGVYVYVPINGLSGIYIFHPAGMRKIDYVPGPDYDQLSSLITPFFSGLQKDPLLQRMGMIYSPEIPAYDLYDIFNETSGSYTDSTFKFTNDVRQFVSVVKYTKNIVKDADGDVISVEQHDNASNVVIRYEFTYF